MPPHPNFPCHRCGQQFGPDAIVRMIRSGPRSASTAVCSECTTEPEREIAAGNCMVCCCGWPQRELRETASALVHGAANRSCRCGRRMWHAATAAASGFAGTIGGWHLERSKRKDQIPADLINGPNFS
jgi:hypothetical protein